MIITNRDYLAARFSLSPLNSSLFMAKSGKRSSFFLLQFSFGFETKVIGTCQLVLVEYSKRIDISQGYVIISQNFSVCG